ncbi:MULTISPECIES: hypothetical protein [unclassified Mycobacterium]|uniref:hypothetical protein n=1 Tax=unclassified Mycobacterium TaxID=2642494 RepID=UPI0029C939A3|nr:MULTISPECIES: hypothetical protein [unclassified Mycobacterium]
MTTTNVLIAQLVDMHPGVRLALTDDGWRCDEASHEVWFGEPFLGNDLLGPWTFPPGYVRLAATNGTWVWRLTDEWCDGTSLDVPARRCRGLWPD